MSSMTNYDPMKPTLPEETSQQMSNDNHDEKGRFASSTGPYTGGSVYNNAARKAEKASAAVNKLEDNGREASNQQHLDAQAAHREAAKVSPSRTVREYHTAEADHHQQRYMRNLRNSSPVKYDITGGNQHSSDGKRPGQR